MSEDNYHLWGMYTVGEKMKADLRKLFKPKQ